MHLEWNTLHWGGHCGINPPFSTGHRLSSQNASEVLADARGLGELRFAGMDGPRRCSRRQRLCGLIGLLFLGIAMAPALLSAAPRSDGELDGAPATASAAVAAPWPIAAFHGESQDVPEILQRLQSTRGQRSQRELNEIRERRVGGYEREHVSVLRELHPVVAPVRASTFEVINPTYWVSMGAVITADGYAVTKASELEQDQPIKARFGRDKTVDATLVKIDTENDLAVLKLADGNYQPIVWQTQEPQPGHLLLSVGVREPVMALGVCSCEARSLLQRNRGRMGVAPRETADGIAIYQVQSAARRAGLQDGDIIVSVQGREVKKVPELVSLIRKYRAGDELTIKTKRGESLLDFTIRLSTQDTINRQAPRFEAMNLLGSINSQRAGLFPWAMQHDTPLLPEQCGGPLVNLDGQAVGLNLARSGRTSSYALTGEHLQEVLQALEIPGWSP